MAELLLAAGLIGTGYLVNSQYVSEESKSNNEDNFQKVMGDTLEKNTKNYNKFKKGNPHKIIPGPPSGLLNKIDNTDFDGNSEKPPIKFIEKRKQEEVSGITSSENFSGFSLTGEPINPETFKHNNQVPYFGGTVKQNTDENATKTRFESMTGENSNGRMKQEIGRMFPLQNNVSNVYGMQNLSGNQRDRYYVGNKRNKEAPIQQQQVGPGLNKGYTNRPTGGFQQAETRDYALPKTVDELRVKSNPKVTYKGRIISGKHISKRGVQGKVKKNRPDTFFIQTADRLLTTLGAVIAPKNRPAIVMRSVKRPFTNKKFRLNPANSAVGGKKQHYVKGKYRKSRRNKYKNELFRFLNGTMYGTTSDYGKPGYKAKFQNREDTQPNKRQGNVQSGNKPYNNYIKDPNDRAKTTIKETTLNETNGGNLTGTTKSYIKNPNDRAKTTTKETTLSGNRKGVAHTRNMTKGNIGILDKIKTTIRELVTGDGSGYYGEVNGAANAPSKGAYNLKKIKLKKTGRSIQNREEFGTAGATVPKLESRKGIKNMRKNNKRTTKGRTPTPVGAIKIIDKSKINMKSKRKGYLNNRKLQKRGKIVTKVYNSLPQKDASLQTKHRKQYKQENRNDPGLLKAFKENPYTKSLESWGGYPN